MQDRVRLLERREVDELIILDIAATPNNRGPRFEQVAQLTQNLFMPVTVGGGVRNVADIARLLRCGADKVAINTAALDNPELINAAATRFGAQAIVVSMDVRGDCIVAQCGTESRARNPIEWAKEVQDRGAGEILLTSVERDGMLCGFALDLIRAVVDAVSVPVIAAGGCGSPAHMAEAFKAGAHAVAVGAMFQFCDETPRSAARYLDEQGIAVRL